MQYGEQTWSAVAAQTQKVVVMPLGSLEQHGHHLPLLTDSLICSEIARRAADELGDEALFLPVLWLGASDHHRGFPGTVSLANATYVQVVIELLESLIGAGFRRIFLLNAHGGNEVPGAHAIYDVQRRHYASKPELWLAFGSWMGVASEQIAAIDALEQQHVTHACELETSMILRLNPALVTLEAARGATIPFESAFYSPDFSRPSRVQVPRSFDQLSVSGAFGHPEVATVAKGEELFSVAVREVVAFIREFAAWQPLAAQ
jgi:creatinine amidohydrolase